ncbi:hypothetical protein BCR39DRAFT_593285 [Naematelia encephala]|uniref:Ysc84 actin-binding domain-containing protein n=1 Tax=Naematelia encephala TaxID=71784 RepID=A0A1Y2BBC8_9TREE|nr:hypothetical protein BCR39DRAFT_593285 [Naematelia encephala]
MSLKPPPPPPRRSAASSSVSSSHSSPDPAAGSTWKSRMKAKGASWGKVAVEKGTKISDNVGGKVNNIAEKRFGTEAFWPVTGDFPKEMDKCARILRAFTVDGVITESKDKDKKKGRKVLRKIPPAVIQQAKGLAIFTSMRTGIAPFGGAGGAGLVVAKLPDGTWSAPASITPNNLSAGFMLGVDVYDCILVIRSQKALDSFATHKATLGTELGVAAGPYGAGAAVEAGMEKAPLLSYVRSRGVYAGVELVGQVFIERFEENAHMYHWPGVKAGDILSGKVRIPVEAANLQKALQDAESGKAQMEKGGAIDIIIPDDTELDLADGEVLKLPPTPDQTDGTEHQSDPETERVHYPSRPVSTASSRVDLIHPTPRAPPPLPSRRPPILTHRSSTSNYSDAEEDLPGSSIATRDAPPSYATEYAQVTRDEYPSEKSVPVQGIAGMEGYDENEPMTEAERREWEQFYAEHVGEGSLAAAPEADGGSVEVVTEGLSRQHLDTEEDHSLR